MAEKIQKHLDTQRDLITDMYINRKLPINEIHRELVHFKLPWFSENQLRYAIKRWGLTPPATANPSGRGSLAIADPSNRHISAPAGPVSQNVHNQSRQPGYHSLPTEWMRTSAIGVSATMAAAFRNEPMQMEYTNTNAPLPNMQYTAASTYDGHVHYGPYQSDQHMHTDYGPTNHLEQAPADYDNDRTDDRCSACGGTECRFC